MFSGRVLFRLPQQRGLWCFFKLTGRSVTSDVVSDAGPEAAPPGDEDPLKDLPVDAAWLHDDDWARQVKERGFTRV